MAQTVLVAHVEEGRVRGSVWISLAAHAVVLTLLLLGVELFEPEILTLGGEPGQGGGGTIHVGLVGDLGSGGAGMYKPSIKPQPEAFTVPPEEKKAPEPEPAIDQPVFEQAKPVVKKEPEDWRKKPPPKKEPPKPVPAGVIPTDPKPGSGGRPSGGGPGLGEGLGSGGVSVGSGDGSGGIDSWYVRQVERRVGENWLKTSLGDLQTRVRTKISFEITAGGQIQSIQIEESSGNAGVDLAAQRAILASNPLPPLPVEMRRRRIKFVANFEYPPR